jgi:hypothetical protein
MPNVFLIWSNKHGGAFYRADSRGYTENPDIAGRFTEEECIEVRNDTHGDCVGAHEKSIFVAEKRREYLNKKRVAVRSCLQTMTPKQVLEIMPDLVQERIDLFMKGVI